MSIDRLDSSEPGARSPPRVDRSGRRPRRGRLRPEPAQSAVAAAGPQPPRAGRRSGLQERLQAGRARRSSATCSTTSVIYLVGKADAREQATAERWLELIQQHQLTVVAIGNGTACRETEDFFAETARRRT